VGSYTVTVTAVDATGASASTTFRWEIFGEAVRIAERLANYTGAHRARRRMVSSLQRGQRQAFAWVQAGSAVKVGGSYHTISEPRKVS
jgi:hypothetical protein